MKNFGKKFIISCFFVIAAIVLLIVRQPLYAAVACLAAFFLNTMEVKEYSTYYQFINFHVQTALLGYSVDLLTGEGTFYYTLCMLLLPLTGVIRLEGLKALRTDANIWVELLGLLSVYGLYFYAGSRHPASWEGWVLPALPILFMTYIGTDIFFRGLKQRKARKITSARSTELGKKAPRFSLQDVEGKNVSLDDFENRNHVLLIFVRGDWCPTCHIMIRAYENNREKFLEKGIVPIGISPDTTEVNKNMMERLGWKNMLLADTNQEVADQYGILFTANNAETDYQKGIALPASFLVDKNGILRYMSRSDKAGEFLSPSLIFPIIDNLS